MKLKFLSIMLALFSNIAISSEIDISAKNISTHDFPDVAGTPTGAVTIAKEFLKNNTQEVAFDTLAQPRSIQYIPTISIVKNSFLKFNLTNCVIKKNAGMLYLVDKDGDRKAMMIAFEADINGNYKTATFYFEKVVDAYDETLVNKRNLFLSTQYSSNSVIRPPKSPNIIVNKGLVNSDRVTIEVSEAQTSGGLELSQVKTEKEDLVKVVDGLIGKIQSPANSLIDIKKDRLLFLPSSTTTKLISFASGIKLLSAAEIGFKLNWIDEEYDIVIERDKGCSGLHNDEKAIQLYPTLPRVFSFSTDEHCRWQWKGNFGDSTGVALTSTGLKAMIFVNGVDLLESGDWKITLKIRSMDLTPISTIITPLNKKISHSWKLDGVKFKIPYLHTSLEYGSYIILTNSSKKDAEVFLNIYSDQGLISGTTQEMRACSNVILPPIPANSTATYYPNLINNAIDDTIGCANFSTTNERYMGEFLVAVIKNGIDVVAFRKNGVNGKRSIPILTERKNHDWGQ